MILCFKCPLRYCCFNTIGDILGINNYQNAMGCTQNPSLAYQGS